MKHGSCASDIYIHGVDVRCHEIVDEKAEAVVTIRVTIRGGRGTRGVGFCGKQPE